MPDFNPTEYAVPGFVALVLLAAAVVALAVRGRALRAVAMLVAVTSAGIAVSDGSTLEAEWTLTNVPDLDQLAGELAQWLEGFDLTTQLRHRDLDKSAV